MKCQVRCFEFISKIYNLHIAKSKILSTSAKKFKIYNYFVLTKMTKLINIDSDKCSLSFTCIRVCPVKAIKIEDKHAIVMHDRCIGCGSCFTVCKHHAISVRNEKEIVREMIGSGVPVAAICDPSISGEFTDITDYRKFVAMIRALGFKYVLETAFGIDLIALKYKKLFNDFHGKYYITANCPAVVSFVEMYHPELTENIAPIVPPYIAMAKVVRHFYGNDLKIVLLTPCIAAKDDIKRFQKEDSVDAALTFRELRELFSENGISENIVEFSDFDPPVGRKGGLMPISHGMLQLVDINQELLSGNILIVNGKHNVQQAVSEFKTEIELRQHIHPYLCEGCYMGPGMSPGGKKYLRRSEVIKYVNKRLKGIDLVTWSEQIENFKDLELSRSFKANDRRLSHPQETDIQRVLIEMEKPNEQDQLNCGTCGYSTCYEFAVAHCQGLANYEMCNPYTIQNLNNFISKLNYVNEKLRNTREALRISENRAKEGEIIAKEANETISMMLDKMTAGVVIVDENLKIIESNKAFIEMAGEDAKEINEMIPGLKGAALETLVPFHKFFSTVMQSGEDILNRDTQLEKNILNVSIFTIRKHKIVGGIMRDLSAPDVKKEEIINRARMVINDNLETVQQIAFLLGETASKTENVLRSIIDTQMFSGVGK